jgi:hypothetical protein
MSSGQIRFYKLPFIDKTYRNVIDFIPKGVGNPKPRVKYFNDLTKKSTLVDCRRVRENETRFQVNMSIDELLEYNYFILYYDDKDLYCFLDDVIFIDENNTMILFTIDNWQTYLYDKNENFLLNIRDSYVLREHRDRFEYHETWFRRNIHRVPEGLDIGNRMNIQATKLKQVATIAPLPFEVNYYLVAYMGDGEDSVSNKGMVISGEYSGLTFFLLPYIENQSPTGTKLTFRLTDDGTGINTIPLNKNYVPYLLRYLQQNPKVLFIRPMKYLPFDYEIYYQGIMYEIVPLVDGIRRRGLLRIETVSVPSPVGATNVIAYNGDDLVKDLDLYTSPILDVVSRPTKDTTPYNQISPYTLFNPKNESKIYSQEFYIHSYGNNKLQELAVDMSSPVLANNEDITIKYTFGMDVDFVERINALDMDKDYNADKNYSMTKNLNQLTLINDTFIDYMISNRNQVNTQETFGFGKAIVGIGSIIAGATIGMSVSRIAGAGMIIGGVSMITSGSEQVAMTEAKKRDVDNAVDAVKTQSGTLYSDLINDGLYIRRFIYTMQEPYYSKIVNYLTRFGYNVNEFKIPNLTSRYWYNYIKAINVILTTGEQTFTFPSKIQEWLLQLLGDGITIWHVRQKTNGTIEDKVFNYDYENAEIALMEGA